MEKELDPFRLWNSLPTRNLKLCGVKRPPNSGNDDIGNIHQPSKRREIDDSGFVGMICMSFTCAGHRLTVDVVDGPESSNNRSNIDQVLIQDVADFVSRDEPREYSLHQTDICMQVTTLEQSGWYIEIKESVTRAKRARCFPKSIRSLSPNEPLDDDIVDVVPGLIATPRALRTVHLNTDFYPEIEQDNFGRSRTWLGPIAHERPRISWALPICTAEYCVAVRIDWQFAKFWYYDPISSAEAEERRDSILKVGPCFLDHL
jgi:hypothetical protein